MKLAIVINNPICENWIIILSQKIYLQKNIDLDTIIIHDTNEKSKLNEFYLSIEKKLFKPNPDFISRKNIKNHFDGKIINSKELLGCDIKVQWDLIVDINTSIPPNSLKPYTNNNFWKLSYSLYNHKNNYNCCFNETLKQQLCGVTLLNYDFKGNSFSKIDNTVISTDYLSVLRNQNQVFANSIPLIIRNLNSNKYLKTNIKSRNDVNKLNTPSSTSHLAFHLLKYFKALINYFKSKLTINQWILLYRFNDQQNLLNLDLKKFEKIIPPKDRFWADPFIVNKNNKYYIFFEELIYKEGVGFISVLEINEDGKYSKPIPIIKKDYHLSYPFLIEHNGELFMIPESSQNKTIELYKCINFPYEWEFEKNIMEDVIAVDTTIYMKENTFWLFTNLQEYKGVSKHTELHLFSAKDLLSNNWEPNNNNPIVKDASKARQAGNLFKHSNKLFRPSQDCGFNYGGAININEIELTNNKEYSEKVIKKITPLKNSKMNGIHTINQVKSLVVADTLIRRNK